jgi:hypothetical protein
VQPEEQEDVLEGDGRGPRAGKAKERRKLKVTQLTMDQKLDIASAELDAAKKEMRSMEASATRMIETLEAVLEQADLRIADLKREAYEFKRDVVLGGENPRTGAWFARLHSFLGRPPLALY